MKLLRIKLTDQLHARLKVQAATHDTSMQDLAQGAIEDLIAQCEPNPRLVRVVQESMDEWDKRGKPYPDHLQSAVDQLGLGKTKAQPQPQKQEAR